MNDDIDIETAAAEAAGDPDSATDALATAAPVPDEGAGLVDDGTEGNGDDANARLFATWEAAGAEVRRAEAALEDLEARRRTLLDAPIDGDVDAQLAAFDALEEEQAALDRRLATARRRYLLLTDATHRLRLLGRSRRVEELRTQVGDLYAQEATMRGEIGVHQAAIDALERDVQTLAMQRKPIESEAVRIDPHPARPLRVSLASVSPWLPPTEVLVKGSAWRAIVERARAMGKVGEIDLAINEHTGQVVGCSQLDTGFGVHDTKGVPQ